MRTETEEIIHSAYDVLVDHRPMTLRQVFYRLVAAQIIENTQARYKSLSRALVLGRQEGMIPWHWIEDRLRLPRPVSMWSNLSDFSDAALASYRRDVWAEQVGYVEVWLEKDALSGIFERALDPYGITLNVGRGYDSWSSIWAASERYGDRTVNVLYFGDFDPSGVDMVRSLRDRLGFFDCWVPIEQVALTMEDIERYELPPNPAKRTDTRAAAFIARYGDQAVELDALPPDVLEARIIGEVEGIINLSALELTKAQEDRDLDRLRTFLENVE